MVSVEREQTYDDKAFQSDSNPAAIGPEAYDHLTLIVEKW